MNKIWVLGGHGMVGEALQKLAPNYEYPNKTEFEIGNTSDFPFKKGDVIIDLVPTPPPRMYPGLEKQQFHQMFTQPHFEFIEKIKNLGIKKYVFLSSGGAIYGKRPDVPIREEDPLCPVSNYGESKKMMEEYLRTSGLIFTILRPSNIFNSLTDAQKQSGLIGTYLKQFSNNQEVDVFGSMAITKDYIANEDVARAIVLSVSSANNEILNIGSGVGYSISDVIDSFEKAFKTKVPINMKPAIANDVPWMILDVSKAKRILNFSAQIDVLNWIATNTNPQS